MNLLTCRRVLIPVGWLALAMAGCSTEPPQPSVELTRSEVTPAAALQAMSAEPRAIFHPTAEPAARALAIEVRRLVEQARTFENTQTPEAANVGRQAGMIVGQLERALRCAQGSRIERGQLNRTSAAWTDAAAAFGLASDAPKDKADALPWAERQDPATRLAIPVYQLATKLPADLQDEMERGRRETNEAACP